MKVRWREISSRRRTPSIPTCGPAFRSSRSTSRPRAASLRAQSRNGTAQPASRIDLDEGFERPVDVKVGPDGLVCVLDFGIFNPTEKMVKVFPKTGRAYRVEPVPH